MSINFDKISLEELLELEQLLVNQVFNDMLTKKIKEGKMVFSEVQNGLMN